MLLYFQLLSSAPGSHGSKIFFVFFIFPSLTVLIRSGQLFLLSPLFGLGVPLPPSAGALLCRNGGAVGL